MLDSAYTSCWINSHAEILRSHGAHATALQWILPQVPACCVWVSDSINLLSCVYYWIKLQLKRWMSRDDRYQNHGSIAVFHGVVGQFRNVSFVVLQPSTVLPSLLWNGYLRVHIRLWFCFLEDMVKWAFLNITTIVLPGRAWKVVDWLMNKRSITNGK